MPKRLLVSLFLLAGLAPPLRAAERPLKTPPEKVGRDVRALYGDSSTLWLGRYEEGDLFERRRILYRLDTSGAGGDPSKLPDPVVIPLGGLPRGWDALYVADGALYIGSEMGLLKWAPGTPAETLESLLATPSRGRIRAVIGVGPELWLGGDGGIFRWSKNPAEPPRPLCEPGPACPLARLPRRPVNALRLVDGELWIGLENAGLYRWRVGSAALEEVKLDDQPADEVSALWETPGALWVGAQRGLYRHDRRTGQTARVPLNTGEVYALFLADSTLWIGADEGLFALNVGEGWEAGLAFKRRLDSLFPPEEGVVLQWKIDDFAGRTNAQLVTQSVTVYGAGGEVVRGPEPVPPRAHTGGGEYTFALDPLRREGDYAVEVRATDLSGTTVSTGRMPLKVGVQRLSWYMLAPAALGGLVILFAASVRLRRRSLILLGRRWRFVGGRSDVQIRVRALGGAAELTQESEAADSPVVPGVRVELNGRWPPPAEKLKPLRPPDGALVRVVADEAAFRWPWAHVLADGWSEGKAVAGQLAVGERQQRRAGDHGRHVIFTGLSCARGYGHSDEEKLPGTVKEVSAVSESFRAWKAEVTTREQADVAAVVEALRGSDVVHVASHATLAGIDLADRRMTVADLTPEFCAALRCRLLILSACDAGRIEDGDTSFVFRLVLSGVNVIAATRPVRDKVCATFFKEFYRALLPGKRVGGVTLASAIRRASEACGREFGARFDWQRYVDSFILYGDPSLRLELVSPRASDEPR